MVSPHRSRCPIPTSIWGPDKLVPVDSSSAFRNPRATLVREKIGEVTTVDMLIADLFPPIYASPRSTRLGCDFRACRACARAILIAHHHDVKASVGNSMISVPQISDSDTPALRWNFRYTCLHY